MAEDVVISRENVNVFRAIAVRWYRQCGREFPWRDANDPFRLLIAEMMLRRTQASQVTPIYMQLFAKYPGVRDLAVADEVELKGIVSHLGLTARAYAFKLAAIKIMDEYGGLVPRTREQLKTLDGVGDYIAGAVLSIGFNQKEWLVDSSIARLLRSYFGVEPTDERAIDKEVEGIAKLYSENRNPRLASLALIDFSAALCNSKRRLCFTCPLRRTCRSCTI